MKRGADETSTPSRRVYTARVSSLFTTRLELRPGNLELFSTPPHDRDRLAALLDVTVPENWPVDHYDEDPLAWCRAQLARDPASAPWLMRYVIHRPTNTLVGTTGCGPAKNGEVVIGYAILDQYRRQGFASEALAALLTWIFGHDGVERIVGYTYPELTPSIGVLLKSGFVPAGDGPEPGTVRYELSKCYTPPAP